MENSGIILETKNIKKTFVTGNSEVQALKGVSFCLKKGEIYLNGRLEEQYSKEPHATEIRNKHIGFIFQDFSLLNDLSVRENVSLPLVLKGGRDRKVKDTVESIVR